MDRTNFDFSNHELKLPDPEICRAQEHSAEYACCLVKAPYGCPYIGGFANGFLCKHPQRNQIIARTLAAARGCSK